jgi:hypothetical protein
MAEILYPILALASWAAVVYRFADLRRDWRSPALRALCAALTCIALTTTITIPAVALLVDDITGLTNLAILSAQICIVLFSASVQWLLLLWSYPPAEARRRARRRVPLLLVILVAMAVLFLLAPLDEHTTSLAGRYAGQPYVAEYLAVYLGAVLFGQAAIARLGWRYAKISGRPWLRRGLRITVVGAVVGMGFCLSKAIYLVGVRFGVPVGPVELAAPVFAACSGMLLVVGLTLPAWGPRLAPAAATLRRYRYHRQLAPLWTALYRAVPEIALVPPSGRPDWFVTHDLDFRLYRRVIEIRDGRLALRPYLDERVTATALRLGRDAGLSGPELDATVEAAVLAAAIRAKHEERAADSGSLDAPGGSDLPGELAWLVAVATAFASSTVVRAALRETAPAAATT